MKAIGNSQSLLLATSIVLTIACNGLSQQANQPASKENRFHPTLQIVPRALAMVPGNRPIIEELQLLDYQLEDLQQIEYTFRKSLGDYARTSKSKTVEQRKADYNRLYEKLDADMEQVLLPNQFQRIKQLALQSLALNSIDGRLSIPNLLANASVQKTLQIDAILLDQLRQQMKKENERVAVEIEKLKQEAEANVLAILPEDQRSALQEMIGEPFDFQGYRAGKGGRFRPKRDNDH